MTAKMKAMVAEGYGSPDVFKFTEVNQPEPRDNEVLVKVIASAVTTADTMMRTGKPYFARLFLGISKPKKQILGTGFAGIVEKTGKNASNFKIGDRVFGETAFGFSSNAEYLTISEDGVILPMPENLHFAEAANFCDGHLTSYNFLKEIAKVNPGQKILINGASGALGTSAIQIAKYMGAHITAVCSGRNVGLVESLGADVVIDYQLKDFTKGKIKYDYVYDTIGKRSFSECKAILSEKGVYLSPVLKFSLLLQMIRTSLFGQKKARFEATGAKKEEKLRHLLSEVVDIYNEGKLRTVIDRQFPLEKVAEAHRYIDAGHKRGNVVIITTNAEKDEYQ